MASKKEDKVQIRQFKDKSSNFWVNYSHYYIDSSERLLWASGEEDTKEYRELLEAYVKRNKKKFAPREISVLDKPEIKYSTLTFGKYSGRKLNELYDEDKQYCKWLYKNVTDADLKKELETLIK